MCVCVYWFCDVVLLEITVVIMQSKFSPNLRCWLFERQYLYCLLYLFKMSQCTHTSVCVCVCVCVGVCVWLLWCHEEFTCTGIFIFTERKNIAVYSIVG